MMKDELVLFSKVTKAQADVNRIRVLKMLGKKKMCVCELAFVLGITQPSVSRHLKKLKSAGFIDSEQNGLWTNYLLNPQNSYARNFLKLLKKQFNDSVLIKQDLIKIRKANRAQLCGMRNGKLK